MGSVLDLDARDPGSKPGRIIVFCLWVRRLLAVPFSLSCMKSYRKLSVKPERMLWFCLGWCRGVVILLFVHAAETESATAALRVNF